MLQQTQVDRVIPFYTRFIKKFPTARVLARAPLREALVEWQGLGYNRRAKMLHNAAKEIVMRHNGVVPSMVNALEALSGVGPYTACAVVAFAFNQQVLFVETNIRTSILHHFFPKKKKVSDGEVRNILSTVLPKNRSREWYSALMDYGAHLKRSGISLNTHSYHYTKQSKFAGSSREARGAILRMLSGGAASRTSLADVLGASRRAQVLLALSSLDKDGLIEGKGGRYTLAD